MEPDLLKSAYDALHYLVFHATRAVTAFLQRDSYLYWPFILSTLALVGWAAARSGSGQGPGFFSAKLWWHPSARADYRLYLANALLFPLLLSPLLLTDGQVAGFMNSLLGLPAASEAAVREDVFWLRLAFTLAFFVAYDLGRFVAHSLLHDVPALWEFHKVHHSAEVLTPMTAYRAHPLELLVMAWVPALLTGSTAWMFNLLGAQVGFFSFLGLHVFVWVFNLIDNLRHSPTWIDYGPRVGRWLISPAHHQLHHSCESRHIGCNRGSNLALWDRLYGTLYVPAGGPERFRLGLGDGTEAAWNAVGGMYCRPFASCLRGVFGRYGRSPAARSGASSAPASG